ncbi:hypothetical protein BC826DRAFT_582188 [Russula brevipes]|nr:hypothetical protein BC826DRAFT_582188 [Russula brevipes]
MVRARRVALYKPPGSHQEIFILTLMAWIPSWTWVHGPRGPPIARRPCPYRGNSQFVWASVHAPSQYFPVPLRPSGWAGPFFVLSTR